MQYIQKVISRIEKGKTMIINFNHDEFSRQGSKAKAIGITRWENRWLVEIEFNLWQGASDTISLNQYMEKTHDIL